MLLIGAIMESYRSLKDKTIKVTFETQEPTPEMLTQIALHNQKFGFLAFKEDAFKEDEKTVLMELESSYEDNGKTPSKRLRDVLFVMYKQDDKGYDTFSKFYDYYMEQFIKHVKGKLV